MGSSFEKGKFCRKVITRHAIATWGGIHKFGLNKPLLSKLTLKNSSWWIMQPNVLMIRTIDVALILMQGL